MRRSIAAMIAVLILSGPTHADEGDAVKLVEKLGGYVVRDDKQPGKPVIEVNLFNTKVTDADLVVLKDLKQLKKLDLTETQISGTGLKALKGLKQLTHLSLFSTEATDTGMKAVAELGQLTHLKIDNTRVSDAGLKELQKLTKLQHLTLHATPNVTAAGLKILTDALPGCSVD